MKTLRYCLFVFLLAPQISHSTESPSGTGWTALPRGRPFPSLISDPRDQKIGLRKNSRDKLEADVAGYRSFTGWRGDVAGENTILHIGLEGGAFFMMRQEGSKFPLESSDGVIGLYSEAARGLWGYQLRYTHLSAHLSDGLYNAREKINYSRETLSLRVSRQIGALKAYVGYHFLAHTLPKLPRHGVQVGGYAIAPFSWWKLHPYLGADYLRRNSFEGNQFQISSGLALLSSEGAPPLRFSVSYFRGHDPRGQFYWERTSKWSYGLDLDF